MYYRHFGLTGAPFQFTPSPKLLFMSKAHRETRTALEWSLEHEPSGFSLLIGETGTGKTTLIISLLAASQARIRIAYVNNPKLGFDGLLRDISRQLGVSAHVDRLELFYAFERYLETLAPSERAVVIVDEAQALSDETLEDLRLFSNRELHHERRLHLVFAGQPGLLSRLSTPGLRQLNERIGARVLLHPLEGTEARAYVEYRLAAFDGSVDAVFARGALEHLLARSGGIPRRINVYCHNALLLAYKKGESRVSLESVRCSAIDLEQPFGGTLAGDSGHSSPGFMQRQVQALVSMRHGLAPALMAAILAIAGIGSLYVWNSGASRTEEPSSIDASGISDALTANSDVLTENPAMRLAPKANLAGGNSAAASAGMMSADGDQDRQQLQKVRVRNGDTLMTIARTRLGSGYDVRRLIDANPQIGNANHIYPGEILNLPTAGASRSSGLPARQTADLRPAPEVSGSNYDGE
jgi:type II secretory pathway predicted ATPase ExeA